MKVLSIFGILFSLVGIIISIVLLAVSSSFAGSTSIYTQDASTDIFSVILITGGTILFINVFFFAFSIAATMASFRKKD